MDVIAVDANPDEATARRLGFRYASLEAALGQADVVTLHVPATPETRTLLDDRAFALMKPGAVLINTARGSVVDAEALVRALAAGRLAGAGLDVLPHEPQLRDEAEIFRTGASADFAALVANHALLKAPNVLVTPHNAYNTTEAVARIIDTTLANIDAFARGAPQNVIVAP
jgi:D-lactate dehydrogenase